MKRKIIEYENCPNCQGKGGSNKWYIPVWDCDICDATGRVIKKEEIIIE